jgi:ATP-dependent DNA helicase RecG
MLKGLPELLATLDGEPADAIESDTLECKPWHPATRDACIRDIREAVVSFANARGGTILLGIEDRKRSRRDAIRGVGNLDLNDLRRRIYDGTDPHILADIEELVEPEGRLVVIRVPRGIPPHTTSEGVGKIRVGKECKPLTGSDLARLVLSAGQRDITGELQPGATVADLDPDEIRRLQRAIETEGQKPELARLEPAEMLQNLDLVRNGEVSLAAVLLLGRSTAIARWAPQHEVIFLRYKTNTRYDVRHDLKGPILSVLDGIERLLTAHLQVGTQSAGGFRELSIPDISWFAAREAILNALVHRDYFLRQAVYIELRGDRLQVTSPGGFMGGVTPQNILRHPPVRRNSLLASVLQCAGFVNRAGVGVDRIYEELLHIGKGLPVYEADEAQVRLMLPTKTHVAFAGFVADEIRAGRALGLDELIVLRSIAERGMLDRWSAADRLQLADDSAAERLVSLRERGYLVPHGRGRGTAYRLSRALSDLLRGTAATDFDTDLDDEAIKLRVQAVLAERGRLTNADVRRLSGYSRAATVRLMNVLRTEDLARLEGRGRGAAYTPGPALKGRPQKRKR